MDATDHGNLDIQIIKNGAVDNLPLSPGRIVTFWPSIRTGLVITGDPERKGGLGALLSGTVQKPG